MKKYIIVLLAIFNINIASAIAAPEIKLERDLDKMPAGEYELDKATSSLTWKVSHYGLSKYTARFAQIDASIYLNPVSLERSKIMAAVSPLSVTTDYPYKREKDFDHELAYDQKWFNAKKYNSIKFSSRKIVITGNKTGKLHGTLLMLGKKRPLTLDVTFNKALIKHPVHSKPAMGFSAKATLKRSDWGMDHMIPNIGNDVDIIIEAEFVKKRV